MTSWGEWLVWEDGRYVERGVEWEDRRSGGTYTFHDPRPDARNEALEVFRPVSRQYKGAARLCGSQQVGTFGEALFQGLQGLLEGFEKPVELASLG